MFNNENLIFGMLMVDTVKEQQREFDNRVKPLSKYQTCIADDLEAFIYKKFTSSINKENIPTGAEELQLRLHAPNKACALLQLHDFITENFGFLPQHGPSSGLQELIPGRLYYIVLWVKKLEASDLFTPEKTA